MEEIQSITKLVVDYGLLTIISAIFIWDWVANKKQNTETLKELKDSNKNIAVSSENIAKSLDIILNNQITEENKLTNIENKIDKTYEEVIKK